MLQIVHQRCSFCKHIFIHHQPTVIFAKSNSAQKLISMLTYLEATQKSFAFTGCATIHVFTLKPVLIEQKLKFEIISGALKKSICCLLHTHYFLKCVSFTTVYVNKLLGHCSCTKFHSLTYNSCYQGFHIILTKNKLILLSISQIYTGAAVAK